ncbi:ribbon-helix-helix domain-containing protein [Thermosulfurimonas dismutans]|uniref:Antitoxin-like ribbon-helix-helix domain-containing protein n=1 Tax=Thermosulfurimonas dismutans TaxID=999894 RepID=A0A179D2M9_9BACT|nr:ribbon-helix-helix domain-containing protein [Thermosulfurimonas dismutans]OAQ20334.1 hypothetical protein TDIS_1529 [Thermosulfurimonas dismutans]
MARPKGKPKRHLNTPITEELLKAFKILAVEQNRRLNDLLEEAMRDLLRKYGRPVPEEGQGEKA